MTNLTGTALIEMDVNNWEEFVTGITDLRRKYSIYTPLVFRGLADSQWKLTTTLERAGCSAMRLRDYYLLTHRIRPAIETATNSRWEIADFTLAMEKDFNDRDLILDHRFPTQEMYRFMIYLRHHGFPSPLLDWSLSPYVAAFFAFRDKNDARSRSVYAYCEYPEGSKGGAAGEARIYDIGRYIRSHPRHFLQQSDYTICAAFDEKLGLYFHEHGPVFGGHGRQDMLWKFNLPSSERNRVLRVLDDYNLNAFSLFGSEESLLEMLWFREHASKIDAAMYGE